MKHVQCLTAQRPATATSMADMKNVIPMMLILAKTAKTAKGSNQ